jgi:hypothetical protein
MFRYAQCAGKTFPLTMPGKDILIEKNILTLVVVWNQLLLDWFPLKTSEVPPFTDLVKVDKH